MDAHTHITRTTVHSAACRRVDWTTWWPWRGAYTRSHPELGREIPQRPWYCVLRHGRVGRRQVFQSTLLRFPQGFPRRGSTTTNAGWSSPVARQAHNLKVTGSNPVPATNIPPLPPRNRCAASSRGGFVVPTGPQKRRLNCTTPAAASPRGSPPDIDRRLLSPVGNGQKWKVAF